MLSTLNYRHDACCIVSFMAQAVAGKRCLNCASLSELWVKRHGNLHCMHSYIFGTSDRRQALTKLCFTHWTMDQTSCLWEALAIVSVYFGAFFSLYAYIFYSARLPKEDAGFCRLLLGLCFFLCGTDKAPQLHSHLRMFIHSLNK